MWRGVDIPDAALGSNLCHLQIWPHRWYPDGVPLMFFSVHNTKRFDRTDKLESWGTQRMLSCWCVVSCCFIYMFIYVSKKSWNMKSFQISILWWAATSQRTQILIQFRHIFFRKKDHRNPLQSLVPSCCIQKLIQKLFNIQYLFIFFLNSPFLFSFTWNPYFHRSVCWVLVSSLQGFWRSWHAAPIQVLWTKAVAPRWEP